MTTHHHKADCLICGEELVYQPDYKPMQCALCRKPFDSNVACAKGHFVCDACHSLPAGDFIEKFCIASVEKDPLKQALTLMRDSRIAMHGPEHHFLVPAVLLSAWYNVTDEQDLKEEKIKLAYKRAEAVPGGFCGYYGDCGAGVGVGIFISVMTGATPLAGKEWQLSNLATGYSLISIAEHGGPRCCKRDSFLAIHEAVKFVKQHFRVVIPLQENIECEFTDLNKQCLKERCKYYPRSREPKKLV